MNLDRHNKNRKEIARARERNRFWIRDQETGPLQGETVQEFLNRGGKVTKCPPAAPETGKRRDRTTAMQPSRG